MGTPVRTVTIITKILFASKCKRRKVNSIDKAIAIAITIYAFLNCFDLSRYFPTIRDPIIPATQYKIEATV
jgi:hypothetical protein